MKRIIASFGAFGVAAVLLAGCSGAVGDAPATSQSSTAAVATSKALPPLADYKGKNLKEARKSLEDLGFEVKVKSDNGKAVLSEANWTVLSQSPEAGKSASVVELTVGKPTSPTTSSPPAPEPSKPAANSGTVSQMNALAKAEGYLKFQAFSMSGLLEQLKYEGFSEADATWGISHIKVDWNEQAAKKAKSYLESQSFSKASLIEQLQYEGFTPEQAAYGVSKTGL